MLNSRLDYHLVTGRVVQYVDSVLRRLEDLGVIIDGSCIARVRVHSDEPELLVKFSLPSRFAHDEFVIGLIT